MAAIDEGTSSARVLLFKAETAEVVCSYQKELSQKYPQEGWVEQDPMEILSVVQECIRGSVEKLISLGGAVTVSGILCQLFTEPSGLIIICVSSRTLPQWE